LPSLKGGDGMIKRTQILSKEGEILSDQTLPYSEILTDEGYKVPVHKLGAKIFADVLFPEEVTHAEIGRMTCLSKLMIGKTNLLGYRRGRDIEAYTEKELAGIVGLKDRQGRQFIKKMYDLHMIHKTETGIYINPMYFMTGQRLSLDLFLIFREELKGFLPDWVMVEFLRQARIKAPAEQGASL